MINIIRTKDILRYVSINKTNYRQCTIIFIYISFVSQGDEHHLHPQLSPNQAPHLPYPSEDLSAAPMLPNFSQPPPNMVPYNPPPPPVTDPYMSHHVPMYHQPGPHYEPPQYPREPPQYPRSGYRGTNYRGTGYRGSGYRGSNYRGAHPRHYNGAIQHQPMGYNQNFYKGVTAG